MRAPHSLRPALQPRTIALAVAIFALAVSPVVFGAGNYLLGLMIALATLAYAEIFRIDRDV
jgi:hypothetical protein